MVSRGVGPPGPRSARSGDRADSWATVTQCPDCGRSLFTTIEDLTASELLARHRWGGGCTTTEDDRDDASEEHPAGS